MWSRARRIRRKATSIWSTIKWLNLVRLNWDGVNKVNWVNSRKRLRQASEAYTLSPSRLKTWNWVRMRKTAAASAQIYNSINRKLLRQSRKTEECLNIIRIFQLTNWTKSKKNRLIHKMRQKATFCQVILQTWTKFKRRWHSLLINQSMDLNTRTLLDENILTIGILGRSSPEKRTISQKFSSARKTNTKPTAPRSKELDRIWPNWGR